MTTATRADARSDLELLRAAAEDLSAFGELVRRHQDFVYGAALRVVRNPTIAEELAQDTFIRAFRAAAEFRGDAQVRSWLYRIASNLALNHVTRQREVATEVIPEMRSGMGSPAATLENNELAQHIAEAIESLPPQLKAPIVLREVEHCSYEEIAERLSIPLNTVRTRILRGRRALAQKLEAWR